MFGDAKRQLSPVVCKALSCLQLMKKSSHATDLSETTYIFLSLENYYCLLSFSVSTRTNKDSCPVVFPASPLAPFPRSVPGVSAWQVAAPSAVMVEYGGTWFSADGQRGGACFLGKPGCNSSGYPVRWGEHSCTARLLG